MGKKRLIGALPEIQLKPFLDLIFENKNKEGEWDFSNLYLTRT